MLLFAIITNWELGLGGVVLALSIAIFVLIDERLGMQVTIDGLQERLEKPKEVEQTQSASHDWYTMEQIQTLSERWVR